MASRPPPINPGMPSSARRAQVYQIDFTAVASGKRIASSKRRVRWRFGFANPEALAAGETGTACRGEEHDVTLVWSITSGKRLVLADGQEVHYSNSRSGLFDFSWTMRGNHVLKIVAHASPPLSPTPGFRQYDFFIDGQSFFSFPKLYRLGLAPGDSRGQRSPTGPIGLAERGSSRNYGGGNRSSRRSGSGIASIEAPHNPDEEEAYLQEAIRQSLDEAPPKGGAPSGGGGGDLLDLGAPAAQSAPALPPSTTEPFGMAAPAPALPPSTTDPFSSSSDFGFAAQSAPAPGPLAITAGPSYGTGYDMSAPAPAAPAYGTPAPAAPAYGAPAPAAPAYGAPAPAAPAYGAPPAQSGGYGAPAQPSGYGAPPPAQGQPPAQTSPWNAPAPVDQQQQQQPYGQSYDQSGPPAVVAPQMATPHGHQPGTPSTLGFQSPPADFSGFTGQSYDSSQPAPVPVPAAAPEQAPIPTDPAMFSMNTLSGDDASAPSGSLVDQAYSKLVNMDTFSLVSKKDEERSNPFEFAGSTTIGGDKSLADMQKTKTTSNKEIMKTPMPAPGAMVVSGQQNGNWGGQYGAAPPMQQPGMQQQPYGAPPMQQPGMQQQYGAPPTQPMQQAGMSQPPYGQAYGQPPPPQQQQQPQYGQPPPQQQYGQPPQQPAQYGQGYTYY